jgi:hypothetical protein
MDRRFQLLQARDARQERALPAGACTRARSCTDVHACARNVGCSARALGKSSARPRSGTADERATALAWPLHCAPSITRRSAPRSVPSAREERHREDRLVDSGLDVGGRNARRGELGDRAD